MHNLVAEAKFFALPLTIEVGDLNDSKYAASFSLPLSHRNSTACHTRSQKTPTGVPKDAATFRGFSFIPLVAAERKGCFARPSLVLAPTLYPFASSILLAILNRYNKAMLASLRCLTRSTATGEVE